MAPQCDVERAAAANDQLLGQLAAGLQAISISGDPARCVISTPMYIVAAAKCSKPRFLPASLSTDELNPWWPHGNKGGFFNVGLNNWLRNRADWRVHSGTRYDLVLSCIAFVSRSLHHMLLCTELPSSKSCRPAHTKTSSPTCVRWLVNTSCLQRCPCQRCWTSTSKSGRMSATRWRAAPPPLMRILAASVLPPWLDQRTLTHKTAVLERRWLESHCVVIRHRHHRCSA